MIYKLILIMYLGRGDFGPGDLAADYRALKNTFEKPEDAASQMIGKADFADYLSDGLATLRNSQIDVDKMTLRVARSRK